MEWINQPQKSHHYLFQQKGTKKMKEKIQDAFVNLISRCDVPDSKLSVLIKMLLQHHLQKYIDGECLDSVKVYDYHSEHMSSEWHVLDSNDFKYTFNDNHTYHCFFHKISGLMVRFGETFAIEPKYCELGPEILDIEISVNGCPKIGGKNCKFCYKNNTDNPPTNMSFETFKRIFDNIPKCLTQIAFGITGTQTNPDFIKMLKYTRENGVIPNYTLSGADLTDEIIKDTIKYCGACAVSCYAGNKELCYETLRRIHDMDPSIHLNIHIVLSEDEEQLAHVWDVLNDAKEKKIVGLRHIVLLRIKPVGRAKTLNVNIREETYEKICKFCMDNNIGFGFDSCSAKSVLKTLIKIGYKEAAGYCEPCESTSFSFYINANGIGTPCSFCEHIYENEGIDVTKVENFSETWNTNSMIKSFREKTHKCEKSCSIFNLD